jgi:hypothetical protein
MELVIAAILPSSWNVAIVLGLLIAAVLLFASEVWPVDIVTLLLLIVLMATGILTPVQAFEGFSSRASCFSSPSQAFLASLAQESLSVIVRFRISRSPGFESLSRQKYPTRSN